MLIRDDSKRCAVAHRFSFFPLPASPRPRAELRGLALALALRPLCVREGHNRNRKRFILMPHPFPVKRALD